MTPFQQVALDVWGEMCWSKPGILELAPNRFLPVMLFRDLGDTSQLLTTNHSLPFFKHQLVNDRIPNQRYPLPSILIFAYLAVEISRGLPFGKRTSVQYHTVFTPRSAPVFSGRIRQLPSSLHSASELMGSPFHLAQKEATTWREIKWSYRLCKAIFCHQNVTP